MNKCVILLLFVASFSAFGQQEELDTLVISAGKRKSSDITISQKREIVFLQPNDVGGIVQKLPGVTLKNYGGIGGMKTASVRGLGSVYQQVVIDGFSVPNTQTGMIDLGNIYASDIEYVSLISGSFSDVELLPVNATMSANTLFIDREQRNNHRPFSLKTHIKYGSFNTWEAYLLNRFVLKEKHILAISGSYRSSNGNYPYRFKNYSQVYSGNRKNADLQEINANIRYRFKISEQIQLKTNYSFSTYDKGLPGAVILYLNSAQQRLSGGTHRANFGMNFDYPKWNGFLYASYINDQLTYLDNGYLNTQGFLKSYYDQQQLQLGWVMTNLLHKYIHQKIGVEAFGAKLEGDISENIQPNRIQGRAYYQLDVNYKWLTAKAQVAGQSISDFNGRETLGQSKIFFQPAIYLATNDWPKDGKFSFFAKRVVRVPGFNDLYYNQVGNIHLKPERADQFQLNYAHQFSFRPSNIFMTIATSTYYNHEVDKIVAVPTKNLFIWMIQNVGMVRVLGGDVNARLLKVANDNSWKFSVTMNYTYQSVTDRTDRESVTYAHQIAYYPEHIGNILASFEWKGLSLSVNGFAVSKRYALNQNISSNEVKGYFTADIQAAYQWKVKDTHQLSFRASCKNVANLSYAYVKYYVMPGINYLLSIDYEF